MHLELVRPENKYLESYLEGCRETYTHVHNSYIIHDPVKFSQWSQTIFFQYADEEAGLNLPPGYVPSVTFWAVTGERYIGTVNIRLRLNKKLADYGGHIGCVLRKTERGKGLAKKLFLLALSCAEQLNIRPVLVTCTEDNLPSLRTLLGMNYDRMECTVTDADGRICPVRRFWFLESE